MTNQPTNTPRKSLLFALCLAFAALLSACDKPQADKAAKPAVQATASAAAVSSAPAADGMPNITTEDMGNLARAMHGAASQQPDDAPKDKYGQPYIIGNLGGVPVNLPSSVVSLVEYDDSPGWDPEKLRTYNPPTRSYQSVITSFGFYFFNSEAQLLDNNDPTLRERDDKDWGIDGTKSDRVGVHISFNPTLPPKYKNLDRMLAADIDKEQLSVPSPNYLGFYEKTSEQLYGLEVYANPGIDQKSGRPWRENEFSSDIFIGRDEEGHVQTYVECSNSPVPAPTCLHYFIFPPPISIHIKIDYVRLRLSQWKIIQSNTIKLVEYFIKLPREPYG